MKSILLSAAVFAVAFQNHIAIKNKPGEPSDLTTKKNLMNEIKSVKIGRQTWSANNISVPVNGMVCYENSSENCKIFGPLYTYEQALEAEKQFPGWRLPTKKDVEELIAFLGGKPMAGSKMKQGGDSGFNALMAGFREADDGKYYRLHEQTGF
jgi:uncharacterized protein (TIGR02145 family)